MHLRAACFEVQQGVPDRVCVQGRAHLFSGGRARPQQRQAHEKGGPQAAFDALIGTRAFNALARSIYFHHRGLRSLDGWRDLDLCAILVRTEIDGEVVGEATAATMLDGPYGAVRFLLGNLKARGFDLSRGLWVSTGAITGVHPVEPGQKVTAVFGGHGSLSCLISQAQPR